jgi:hypothetical protein
MKDKHIIYYLFLGVVLVLGIYIIYLLSPNKTYQFIALCILSIIYSAVGIIHHLINHDLVGKIVIEYVLVAVLGIAAAFFIFRGGFGF